MGKRYSNSRPYLSEHLKRQVKIDAGHKCVITGCNSITCEIHHIDGNRENNKLENLIFLCRNHHKQAHDGYIDKKSLIGYKKNSNFIDRKALALEFYQKHILELSEILRLDSWGYIIEGLSMYRIHCEFLRSFNHGVNFIDNIRYPEEYLDLCKSIKKLRSVLVNLINNFQGCKDVVFIEGKLNCFMYNRWKAERWYPQNIYDEMYKEEKEWEYKIDEISKDLINALNEFAENIWQDILPNYRDRKKFTVPRY